MRSSGRDQIALNKKKTLINLLLQKYPAITSDKWRIKALSGSERWQFYAEATENIKLIVRFAGKDQRLLGITGKKSVKYYTSLLNLLLLRRYWELIMTGYY